jgi:hypothetical protein
MQVTTLGGFFEQPWFKDQRSIFAKHRHGRQLPGI